MERMTISRLESDLRRRLEFEETLKRVSSRFVGIHNIKKAISLSLTDIKNLCKAVESYLFYFFESESEIDISSAFPRNERTQKIFIDEYPWWKERIINGNVIIIKKLATLPEEAKAEKQLLEYLKIKNLLILPLYADGVLSGFLGFSNLQETGFSEDEMALLKMAAEIISNALSRHLFEKRLRESEASYKAIFANTGTATIITDENTLIVLANDEFVKLIGFDDREQLEGKIKWTQFFCEDTLETMLKYHYLRRSVEKIVPNNYEAQLVDKFGNRKYVLVHVAMLPGMKKSIISFTDITVQKNADKKLIHLSYHDALTGLYNRTYFEEEFNKLERQKRTGVGIILCDLDGLKLINNTEGHMAGDALLVAASKILKKSIGTDHILARIGGDEFAILIPNSNPVMLRDVSTKIKNNLLSRNRSKPNLDLNISLGFSFKTEESKSLNEVFKEADDNMYREKLLNSHSRQGQVLNTLSKAIEARDFITGGHAERLQDYVAELARLVGFREYEISDLRLFAKFHDIGKVGISDRVLFKKQPLTKHEMDEMRRHCEIGYRIARTSPDLARIADWILKHHEWWNGSGYPLGIRGKEIPLECRILSIVDAYDAMTSDRPYREAMSSTLAIKELKRWSGLQFDPELLEMFIRYLTEKSLEASKWADLEIL